MDASDVYQLLVLATKQVLEKDALLILKADIQFGTDFKRSIVSHADANTALHITAFKGWKTVCQLLMDEGALLLFNREGYSPLDLAAIYGHAEIVPIIYRKELDSQEYEGKLYPHHLAAMYGNAATVRALCKIENHSTKHVMHCSTIHNLLTLAIKYSNENLKLSLEYPVGVGERSSQPLRVSPKEKPFGDHNQTIKMLLDMGVRMSGPGIHNAMKAAATYNVVEAAQILYNKGYKNLDVPCDTIDDRPLHVAAGENCFYMVQWLLANGADKTIKNKLRKTPYDVAVGGNVIVDDNIKRLLYIPSPQIEKPLGPTANVDQKQGIYDLLKESIERKLVPTCLTLIDINIEGEQTIWELGPFLHLAAQNSLPLVMKALIDKGVCVNNRHKQNQTVSMWLTLNNKVDKHTEMTEIVKEAEDAIKAGKVHDHISCPLNKTQTNTMARTIIEEAQKINKGVASQVMDGNKQTVCAKCHRRI